LKLYRAFEIAFQSPLIATARSSRCFVLRGRGKYQGLSAAHRCGSTRYRFSVRTGNNVRFLHVVDRSAENFSIGREERSLERCAERESLASLRPSCCSCFCISNKSLTILRTARTESISPLIDRRASARLVRSQYRSVISEDGQMDDLEVCKKYFASYRRLLSSGKDHFRRFHRPTMLNCNAEKSESAVVIDQSRREIFHVGARRASIAIHERPQLRKARGSHRPGR